MGPGWQDGSTYRKPDKLWGLEVAQTLPQMGGGWRERGGMMEGWSGRLGCARRLLKQEGLGLRRDVLLLLSRPQVS